MEEEKQEEKEERPEAKNLVERAETLAKKLEEAEARLKETLERVENEKALEILSGKTAGQESEEKKEIDPAEYARMALEGKIPSEEQ